MNEPAVHRPTVSVDEAQLKLLAIFRYVVGVLMMFFSCIPMIHVAIGIVMILRPEDLGRHGHQDPILETIFGYVLAIMGSLAILTGWTMGGLVLYSGRMIRQHRRRMFSLVMAGLMCLFFPFGTALGVFAFLLLFRPSVAALYGE